MKTVFNEYYKISKDEEKRIWDEGLIVVDNNILLNQYRYSKDTSDKVIEVLTQLKDRLWIPYQVGLEYHNNRLECFYNSWNASKTIKERINEVKTNLLNEIKNKYNRNPFVILEEFDEVVNKSFKQIDDKLKEWDKTVTDFVNNDPINKKIVQLFENKVGNDFSNEEIEKIFKEGEKRYSEKVPPGYKDDTPDKRAQGKRNVYGDLIVWKQIIAKAKEVDKDVVFISDDEKEDWWFEWKGKKIYPRVELIREFRQETGHRIILYNQKSFLEYAKSNFNFERLDETIREVEKDIKKRDKARAEKASVSVAQTISELFNKYLNNPSGQVLVDPTSYLVKYGDYHKIPYVVNPNITSLDYLEQLKSSQSTIEKLLHEQSKIGSYDSYLKTFYKNYNKESSGNNEEDDDSEANVIVDK